MEAVAEVSMLIQFRATNAESSAESGLLLIFVSDTSKGLALGDM